MQQRAMHKPSEWDPPQAATPTLKGKLFSHVMTATLVFHNNETAGMSVSQTNPVGVKLFSYVNTFFCS